MNYIFAQALALLNERVQDPYTPETVFVTRQKVVSHDIDTFAHQQLAASFEEDRDKARLNSLGVLGAGDWLNCIPSKALGLHMGTREFRAALKYRLGMAQYPVEGPCTACAAPSDRFGDHSVGCGFQSERNSRHNSLRDALFQTAQQAVLSPRREELFLIPGGLQRPADVFIPNWTAGCDTALDVTVISPLQKSEVRKAAREPGSAADHRYEVKMNTYFARCKQQGLHFAPLVVEALGGWHEQSAATLTKLGRQLARQTGRLEEEAVRQLRQRLSVKLMQWNAALILSRTPIFAEAEVDGDLDTEF